MKVNKPKILSSSFRDPCGFLFLRDGILYRQVNSIYHEHYDALMETGLYEELVQKKLLIPHQDADIAPERPNDAYKIIRPEAIAFISYPYEWSFSQLKQAAISTLEIEATALEYGLTLKDASAYNIQFLKGKAVLIDTLSFERYKPGEPWIAYRQFCQHFLSPLALMAYRDIRLSQLLRIYVDGIPLDLTSSLLPKRTLTNLGILMHIHQHARSQSKHADTHMPVGRHNMKRNSLLGLIDNLSRTVHHLKWKPEGTEWANYYNETNYTHPGLKHKEQIIKEYLDLVKPGSVWDIGANVGLFSRIASKQGISTVAFDVDPACVERNYLDMAKNEEACLLPLLLDLANPSPGIGWENMERATLFDRGPAEVVFALALLHHLAISNNLPFNRIAGFLARICSFLIIEFVPKEDSQVQKLLVNRDDIFDKYTQETFELDFRQYFIIIHKDPIVDSLRTLYLMKVANRDSEKSPCCNCRQFAI